MGFISPQQLYDNPKLWLSVPHSLHNSLGSLMEKLFPECSFRHKLSREHVHCLECEGLAPFKAVTKDTLETKLCTGYIGEMGNIKLLRLQDIQEGRE